MTREARTRNEPAMKMSTQYSLMAATAILCLALPAPLRAQAPPGPIHLERSIADTHAHAPAPVEKKPLPRHELWGNWTLNAAKSDDPQKKLRQASASNRGGNGPVWGGYPGGRGGYPGGRGGFGGRESNADRNRTEELIYPANSLALVHNDAEVDITDDENHKRALFTDGRKLQKSKDDKYKQLAAHWDGGRLVTDEKGPNALKLTRSFEISPNGQQLYETLAVDQSVTEGGFVMLRYVFDPAKQEAQPATATKPSSADAKP